VGEGWEPVLNNDIKIVLFSCASILYSSIFLRGLEILDSAVTNPNKTTEIPSKIPPTVAIDESSLPRKILQSMELSFLLNHLKITQ
jgi:hypothetical protein